MSAIEYAGYRAQRTAVAVGEPASAPGSEPARRFLFVTAPFGPFSRRLAYALNAGGALCERVILNGGDLVDWGFGDAVFFRKRRAAWPAWIEHQFGIRGVTDLITHGDSNPYAVAAMEIARNKGIRVHVFEQGYLRPHWITLDSDGVNAHSSLPRDPAHYANVASRPSVTPATELGRTAPSAVRLITQYHYAAFFMAPLFAAYRHPYAYSPLTQGLGHIRRYVLQSLARGAMQRSIRAFLKRQGPKFVVLLQRPGDSQLVRHSTFGKCGGGFLKGVIENFAANAPTDANLIIKSHPLDHGLVPHARKIREAAKAAGVKDRVLFADGGDLFEMFDAASGVISINSSGGIAALERDRPTIALGEALYDMPGLTHQDGLSSFWTHPTRPDQGLLASFKAVMAAKTQINGAFATPEGIALAAPEAARRLIAAG